MTYIACGHEQWRDGKLWFVCVRPYEHGLNHSDHLFPEDKQKIIGDIPMFQTPGDGPYQAQQRAKGKS